MYIYIYTGLFISNPKYRRESCLVISKHSSLLNFKKRYDRSCSISFFLSALLHIYIAFSWFAVVLWMITHKLLGTWHVISWIWWLRACGPRTNLFLVTSSEPLIATPASGSITTLQSSTVTITRIGRTLRPTPTYSTLTPKPESASESTPTRRFWRSCDPTTLAAFKSCPVTGCGFRSLRTRINFASL